jgi:hypothetical protein
VLGEEPNGEPWRAHAIRGATVCRMLGGAAPQVKAKAAARVFVDSLGKRLTQVPDGYSVDPTEALVGMISRSAFMAATWEAEIAALDDGEADELRMLLAQYDAERDRCARFSNGRSTQASRSVRSGWPSSKGRRSPR